MTGPVRGVARVGVYNWILPVCKTVFPVESRGSRCVVRTWELSNLLEEMVCPLSHSVLLLPPSLLLPLVVVRLMLRSRLEGLSRGDVCPTEVRVSSDRSPGFGGWRCHDHPTRGPTGQRRSRQGGRRGFSYNGKKSQGERTRDKSFTS